MVRSTQTVAIARPARAEASEGDRTTLRVPPDLAAAVDELAEANGITRNAALILLARRGRDAHVSDARLQEARDRIRETVLGNLSTPDGASAFPTDEEYADAILGPRGGR
jgi:hypothetical protein